MIDLSAAEREILRTGLMYMRRLRSNPQTARLVAGLMVKLDLPEPIELAEQGEVEAVKDR